MDPPDKTFLSRQKQLAAIRPAALFCAIFLIFSATDAPFEAFPGFLANYGSASPRTLIHCSSLSALFGSFREPLPTLFSAHQARLELQVMLQFGLVHFGGLVRVTLDDED